MGDEFQFDDFRLDVVNACLWCGDKEIHVTPKAFAVLHYLLSRPGQLVTREQLLTAIWPNVVVGDSALASAIRELRKALGDDARTPRYIETLHRRGYRFIGTLHKDAKLGVAPVVDVTTPRTFFIAADRRYWIAAAVLLVAVSAVVLFHLRESAQATDSNLKVDFAYPLPDKPSIVVLPFDNLSRDDAQDYFVDGFTETITTALARIPDLFVIARYSALTYKDKLFSVQQVAKDLGVGFVLRGSIQKSDERVRITAQLINALSGHHVWAGEYDRTINDIFALQDEITWQVATELEVKLTDGEEARIRRRQTDSAEAYELFLRAWALHEVFEKQELAQAQELYRQAITIDPQFWAAWGGLGGTYFQQARFKWVDDPQAAWKQVEVIGKKIVSADETNEWGLHLLAVLHERRKKYDEAFKLRKKAVQFNPNNPEAIASLGWMLTTVGKAKEAVDVIKQAIRLSPYYPPWYLLYLGRAHYVLEEYDEAIVVLEKLLERRPTWSRSRAYLACTYAQLGRIQEAKAEITYIVDTEPEWTVTKIAQNEHFNDPAIIERYTDLLRQLGLPE